MSTRAASAVSSHKAKQELVRLLYGPRYRRGGPEAHRKLDGTIYKHETLRKEYLSQLQMLHPDTAGQGLGPRALEEQKEKFVELQKAWDDYDQLARVVQKVGDGDKADFTMFAVGCSFADSPEERARRDEITEQACRGWFSAGALPESTETPSTKDDNTEAYQIPLCDDDLFVVHEGRSDGGPSETNSAGDGFADNDEKQTEQAKAHQPRKSLVAFGPSRKRYEE